MIKSNPVKALLKQGKPVFGTWITLCPHPRIIKIFAACGFDFVIIEMEHTDFNLQTVANLVMLAREAGLVPVVRPPGTIKPHDLSRPLDAGAQGLLLPAIETEDQIRKIIRLIKYHPMGCRPMNLKGPHTDYHQGKPQQIISHLNENTLTVVMIETQKGIENLDAICKVKGVDAVMVGPDDLSQDLGVPGEMSHLKLTEAIDRIISIARANRVACGLSCHSLEQVKARIAAGCTWLPYSNDTAMVLNTAREVVPELMKIGGRTR
ncbi:MAG: aldolase [Deltaproteobacteria bacterium]|nr:aldolase [Deltaproteobacteria bacterium]MBW2151439.1 aldolase [Deltaproteobacteria bacterium]